MFIHSKSFKNFISNYFLVSRFVFIIFLFLFFTVALGSFSYFNNILFLLLFSSSYFFVLTFSMIFVIRGEDDGWYDKWNNKVSRMNVMKEKLPIIYFFSVVIILICFLLFFSIKILGITGNVRTQVYQIDYLKILLIFLIIIAYVLLSNSFLFWFMNSIQIIGYLNKQKLLIVKGFYLDLFIIFIYYLILTLFNEQISHYFYSKNHFLFFNSSLISLFLFLELLLNCAIYFFVFRRSKKSFETNDSIIKLS